ncbi:hypothetical protein Btru_006378 [Bulinus truncatus]|nr:hypothetical protein Btru_006378 [Bulinus truncatus]
MPFGQITTTPIIIDSEDEDDDILLVKEEKICHNIDRDDDVIFISKEDPVVRVRTSSQDKLKRTLSNAPVENSTLSVSQVFPLQTYYSTDVTDIPPRPLGDAENFVAALNSSGSFDVAKSFLTAPVTSNDSCSLNSCVPALKILKMNSTTSSSKWHIVQNNEHIDVANPDKPKHYLDSNANCFCSLKGLTSDGSSSSQTSLFCSSCSTLQGHKPSQNISTSSAFILPESGKSSQHLSSLAPDCIQTNSLNLQSNYSDDKSKIDHLFQEAFKTSGLHHLIVDLKKPNSKFYSYLEPRQRKTDETTCSLNHSLDIANAKFEDERKLLLKGWIDALKEHDQGSIKYKGFRQMISEGCKNYSDRRLTALKCQTPFQTKERSVETRRIKNSNLCFKKTDVKKGQLIQLAKKIKYHYFVTKKQNSNLDKSVLKLFLPLNHLTSLPFNKRKIELKKLRKNVLNYQLSSFSGLENYANKRKLYRKDKHKFNDGNHVEWRVVPPSTSGHVKLRFIKVGATSQCTELDKQIIVETQQSEQIRQNADSLGVKEQKEVDALEEAGSIVSKENSLLKNEVVCFTCASFSRNVSKCEKGHLVCGTCLEVQVKNILAGKSKQKHVKCPLSACNLVLPFEELKQSLPSFVVDIIEERFDKAYLQYITQWMFTDEKLKSRSEFATSDIMSLTIDTSASESISASEISLPVEITKQNNLPNAMKESSATEDSPKYWLPMEHGATVMVYEVVPDTEEYKELAFLFHETLEFPNYDIVRILRIQNSIMWKYFALKKSEMVQENNGMVVTEKQLFHGTHRTYVEAIARKGFDWRLSGKHGTVYGCGSYFAKESKYSHGYTDRGGDGISVRIGITPTHQPFGAGHVSRNLMVSAFHSRLNNYFGQSLTQQPVPPQGYLNFSAPALQPSCSFQSQPAPSLSVSSVGINSHSSFFNPFFNSVNQPTHFNSINQPTHLNSTNQPTHLNSTNQPTHLNSTNQPTHLNSTNQPTHLNSTNQPTHLNSTNQPTHLNSINLPTHLNSTNQPTHLNSINQPPHLNSINQPPHLNSVSQPFHFPPSSSMTYGFSTQNNVSTEISSMSQGDNTKAGVEEDNLSLISGTTDLGSVFSKKVKADIHSMFVARVLVGRPTRGSSGLKRPPPIDENCPLGKCYDSCVDSLESPKIFVVFDSNQCYPEYLIEYTSTLS